MTKPFELYTLHIKGKSRFNTIGPLPLVLWIFDLRAIDQITHFPKLFNLYVKMSNEKFTIVVSGDSVLVCGLWNITLESSIVLEDVLYVLQLTNNLIFIQKLAKDLKLFNIFVFLFCISRWF